jgi:outer membrane lipoprotein-sorting protein
MGIKKWLVPAAILYAAFLFADSGSDLLARITAHYQGVKTLQAAFVQTNTWPSMKTTRVSRGTLSYNPTDLSMIYSDPMGQALYINGPIAIMIDPSQKQAIKSNLDETVDGIKPIEVIRKYSRNARLESVPAPKGTVLKIWPKSDPNIRRIDATCDANGAVTEIRYENEEGNRVDYVFSNVRENTALPSLKPLIPRGYEIIDTRE